MSHILSIEIPEITNPKVLRVYDSSTWDPLLNSDEVKLDIISPGFLEPKEIIVSREFDKLLNCSNLGIYVVTDPSEYVNLPDGIYVIRLTNTNGQDSEWVEYNHLRQVCLLNKWYKALCSLSLNPCNMLTKDIEEKRKELYQIKMYIDAAKAKVEYCKSPNDGLELHHYADKLLSKYSENCKTC